MIIVSIKIANAMKCNFVTKTDIQKNFGFCSNAPSPSTKLNSQSGIILTQFLYQGDDMIDMG